MNKCIVCGKEFEKGIGKCCSWSCQGKFASSQVKTTTCECCGKEVKHSYHKHLESCTRLHQEKTCPKCGKTFKGDNKFCSRKCANSHEWNLELKEEHSKIMKDSPKVKEAREKIKEENNKNGKGRIFYTCKSCGKELQSFNRNNTGYCYVCYSKSKECSETRSKNTKKAILEGKLDRWYKSKEGSYAEKWWRSFLEENLIPYEWQKREGLYVLDFVLEKNNKKVDFEVDGRQHDWEERKRHDLKREKDLALKGYVTFRTKWRNIKKFDLDQEKQRFLDFYNNL
jgi:very-short-patch-repair endonuclease/predicted nucleic acid-binding Zn ribbon protein